MSTAPFNLPSIAVPDSEKKTKEYHEKFARAICNSTFTSAWCLNYNKLRMLYSFYMDGTGNDLTGYLQSAPDGTAMPGIWTSQNSVKTRVRALLGELEERSYLIKARALNSEAQSRKREEQERLRVKRRLQDLRQAVEDESGIPLESPEYVPQSEDELREYMDLTWKDKSVLILEGALKWLAYRNNDDESRKRLALDQFIAGISPVCNEICYGLPKARPVDPLKFGFDPNATDDRLSDATYFYEADYIPLAVAAQKYNLTLEELQASYSLYDDAKGLGAVGDPGWGCMPNQCIRWYRNMDGAPRCLVLKIVWRDYKTISNKYEKDEYDNTYFQDMTDRPIKDKDKDKIRTNKIECWRQATLVGGQFLKDWGECPNQARDLSKLHESRPPYEVWINEFFMGKWTSMCEQLVGLQLLKDIALYQLQIQMARAVGKVLVFDEAMMPEGVTRETTARYIKAEGIAFVNSKEYQNTSGNMNLFKEVDLGLSQAVGQSIQLVEYFDAQIDATSGVSPERQGQIQGSSVSTGTTNAALIQSSMVTASFFKGFERFWSRVLQQQARLTKLSWAGKEKFAPIIGDVGVDFLKDNIDISLDEYDVVVESRPPQSIDRQVLTQWLTLAVQADPEFLSDAMSIMLETDTTVAVREFQRKTRLRRRLLAQQAQQEQEMALQAQEAQQAREDQRLAAEMQNERALQAQKDQGDLQKTALAGKVKLGEARIGLYKK